jgi:hypothetical protein
MSMARKGTGVGVGGGKMIGEALGLEPAAVDSVAAGVMTDEVGDAGAAVPADDEIVTRETPTAEVGTAQPNAMTPDEIARELDTTPAPGEIIAKARQDFDAVTKTVEEERAELLAIERDAHVAYRTAQDFANTIARRRQALLNEQRRRKTN